jgi:hypothetical protein
MALSEHIFVVDAEVDPSVEAAWNEWYNTVHLEITACPGFRQSARYVSEHDGMRHYVAVYELDQPEALHWQSSTSAAAGANSPAGSNGHRGSMLYRRIAAAPPAISWTGDPARSGERSSSLAPVLVSELR